MKFGIFYEHQLPRPWGETSELKLFQDALEQVELADRLGIDFVQGYALAKPVPIIECLQAIDQQSSTTAGQRAP